MVLSAWWQVNDHTHAPALDMVSEGGDVNVQVPRGDRLPFVILLKGLLIVHISLNIIRVRIFPVSRFKIVSAPWWLHHSWTDGNRQTENNFKNIDPFSKISL